MKNVLKYKEGFKGLVMGMNVVVFERVSVIVCKILEILDIMIFLKEKFLELEFVLVRDCLLIELIISMMNDKVC